MNKARQNTKSNQPSSDGRGPTDTPSRTHTPGPWTFTCNDGDAFISIYGESGDYVCDVTRYGLPYEGEDEKDLFARQIANARFIASAPEMLEAIRDIHWHALTYVNGADEETPWDAMDRLVGITTPICRRFNDADYNVDE